VSSFPWLEWGVWGGVAPPNQTLKAESLQTAGRSGGSEHLLSLLWGGLGGAERMARRASFCVSADAFQALLKRRSGGGGAVEVR